MPDRLDVCVSGFRAAGGRGGVVPHQPRTIVVFCGSIARAGAAPYQQHSPSYHVCISYVYVRIMLNSAEHKLHTHPSTAACPARTPWWIRKCFPPQVRCLYLPWNAFTQCSLQPICWSLDSRKHPSQCAHARTHPAVCVDRYQLISLLYSVFPAQGYWEVEGCVCASSSRGTIGWRTPFL